jgi:hypothetical protein
MTKPSNSAVPYCGRWHKYDYPLEVKHRYGLICMTHSLKTKPILHFFQVLVNRLRDFFRGPFFTISELNLDTKLKRVVESCLQTEEIGDFVRQILNPLWFELCIEHKAIY